MEAILNTEQIFASQLLDQTFSNFSFEDDNFPASQMQEESANSSSGDIFEDLEKENEQTQSQPTEEFTQQTQSQQIEERLRAFADKSIPWRERYSQAFMGRFQHPTTIVRKKPEPIKLTQEQVEMRQMLRRSLQVPVEVDKTLYDPKARFTRPKDETPAAVRNLCIQKGFVKAREVHDIMSQIAQSQRATNAQPDLDDVDSFVGLTQVEMEEQKRHRERSSSGGSSNYNALSFNNDMEEVDQAVIAMCDEQQILNQSLGILTQKLNNSERAAELIENAVSQSVSCELDTTKIDLNLSDEEDDGDVKCTEQLEHEFLFLFPTHDDDEVPHQPSKQPKETQELEGEFLNLYSTQPDLPKALPPAENGFALPDINKFSGFAKASGKAIKVNDAISKKFEAMFSAENAKIEQNLKIEEQFGSNKVEKPQLKRTVQNLKPIVKNQSRTIRSSDTPCSSKNIENSGLQISSGIGNTGMFSGFSLDSEKSVDSKANTKALLDRFKAKSAANSSGFSFVSGKDVKVKAIDRFKSVFDAEDNKIVKDLVSTKIDVEPPAKKFKVPQASFNSPIVSRRNPSATSTPLTSKSTRNLAFASPRELIKANTPKPNFSGFAKASGRKVDQPQVNSKRFANFFEKDDQEFMKEIGAKFEDEIEVSPVAPAFKKVRLDFGTSPISPSPFLMDQFKKGVNQHSTPFMSRMKNETKTTDSQEVSSIEKLLGSIDSDDEFMPSPPKKPKLGKMKLLNKFNASVESNDSLEFDALESILADEMNYKSLLMITNDVKMERKRALEEQKESIKLKMHSDRLPMAGSVYMIKNADNRIKTRDFVDNAKPKNLNRHHITLANAADFKFSLQNHVDESTWKTKSTISVGDNARIVIDEQSKIGFNEIMWSFLASPGVEPKLATESWITNAFKMILLKLALLENSFEKFDKFEVLNPENVLLQLKYRYDREIDRHQRSAIKKIVEGDDIACRRMVLKVLDVYDVSKLGYELELTDGWYSIRTTIDAGLANAVDSRKIVIGTKLITSYAELIGCEAMDPLNMPSNVRLKIHANSTRRTKHWDEKMGFCENKTPIRVSLDSVLSSGGVIGKLTLMVTHVYPIIYVDSSGEKKEFRSEKLQNRIQNRRETFNFSVYEKIAHQVQQQTIHELRDRVQMLKKTRFKVQDLSPESIYDLLEFETDVDEVMNITSQLNVSLQERVQRVRDDRNHEINQKIREKLGEQDKNLSILFKFRVVDAWNPKKTGIVSWWSPTEDILAAVKEGQTVELINATAGPQCQEFQVTAGKSAQLKVLKTSLPETVKKYLRKDTKISEITTNFKPQQDEFDVACIVVQVNEVAQNSQKVYVADEAMNIMCINFFSSLIDCAYDDVIVEGQFLYARNLQWRLSQAVNKIPQAFVNSDITLFITNPSKESQRERLQQLRNALGNSAEFLIKCCENIASLDSGSFKTNKENLHKIVIVKTPPKVVRRPIFSRTLPNNVITPAAVTRNTTLTLKGTKRRLGIHTNFSKPNTSKITIKNSNEKKLNKPSFSRNTFYK